MLNLKEIQTYYPAPLQGFNRFILREYLQYKILQLIFESDWSAKFCFLGGTCLRIVHGNSRFSEDLDFDNFGVSEQDFDQLAAFIRTELEKEGYQVEFKTVYRGAYHCHIKFPGLLFQEKLSGFQEERILIQLDTEPQGFDFKPELFLLNRFDVFSQINTTPKELILAQKFYAILNRKRNKGRDFYDVVFLLGQGILPNYAYLDAKVGITSFGQLKERINAHCEKIDLNEMQRDVQPFLFQQRDGQKVVKFLDYFNQL
jgi:predicted nucleotidyltransferase component of viral defense system